MVPSAIQASITVNLFFPAPLVRMVTVDVPFFSIVLSAGRSKVNGVWSALPMSESGGFRICTSYGQIVMSHEAISPI